MSLRNLAAILAVSRDYTSHRIPLPRKSMFAISMFRTLCLHQRRCIRISLSLHLNTVPLKTQHAYKSLSLFMDAINLEESTFKIVRCVGDHYRNKYYGALFVSVLSNILIVLTLRSVRHSLCSSLLASVTYADRPQNSVSSHNIMLFVAWYLISTSRKLLRYSSLPQVLPVLLPSPWICCLRHYISG